MRKMPLKTQKMITNQFNSVIKAAAMAFLAMTLAIIMSYLAEPFQQEVGYATSILGGNRDWLVNGRLYFFAGLLLPILTIVRSVSVIHEINKPQG